MMIIKTLRVRRFRCLEDESLRCDRLTALVGANGAGKSSFLQGLDLYYSPTPRIEIEDFYAGETNAEVAISVSFKDLSDEAKTLFSNYVEGNELTVERVFTCKDQRITAKYHGAALQHEGFESIRTALEIKDRGRSARQAYDAIRANPKYQSLPEWSTIGAAPGALKDWETAHPEDCTRHTGTTASSSVLARWHRGTSAGSLGCFSFPRFVTPPMTRPKVEIPYSRD
jgi:hypothetical protein